VGGRPRDNPSFRRLSPPNFQFLNLDNPCGLVGGSVDALASNSSIVKSHIINQQCKIILYKILTAVFNYQ
jgi:hypothetical protein